MAGIERQDLKFTLGKLLNTNLVVETGTEGMWTYRKWSDGTAECWGMVDQSFTPSINWGSTKYVALGQHTFPSNLFNNTPEVIATASKTSGSGMPIVALEAISSTGFKGFINELSGTQYTYPIKISFYAIGKWANYDPSTHTMEVTGFTHAQMSKTEIRALIEASGNQFKDNNIWTPNDLV